MVDEVTDQVCDMGNMQFTIYGLKSLSCFLEYPFTLFCFVFPYFLFKIIQCMTVCTKCFFLLIFCKCYNMQLKLVLTWDCQSIQSALQSPHCPCSALLMLCSVLHVCHSDITINENNLDYTRL